MITFPPHLKRKTKRGQEALQRDSDREEWVSVRALMCAPLEIFGALLGSEGVD